MPPKSVNIKKNMLPKGVMTRVMVKKAMVGVVGWASALFLYRKFPEIYVLINFEFLIQKQTPFTQNTKNT